MSNNKEKETGKAKISGSGGHGVNSNTDAGIDGRPARLLRSSVTTAKKCSADKSKCPEESSAAAKRTTRSATVSSKSASMSAAVKNTAAKVVQMETRGQKEIAQVSQTPRVRKRPESPADKTVTKTPTSRKVWKEKAQAESSIKEVSARKQQAQPSGSISNQSTKTTKSGPRTNSSKLKKSATQKQVIEEDCSPKGQSSQDKQVREKQAKHKASTRELNLETEYYALYNHRNLDATDFEEVDNQIGVCCCLCEQDLGNAPVEGHTEYEYSTLPVAAILPCGHTFHNDCLSFGELEGQQAEPPCVFCDSF